MLASALFGMASGMSSDIPKGTPMPDFGGLATGLAGIGIVFLLVSIAIQCGVGYFDGKAGERIVRGPGYGM